MDLVFVDITGFPPVGRQSRSCMFACMYMCAYVYDVKGHFLLETPPHITSLFLELHAVICAAKWTHSTLQGVLSCVLGDSPELCVSQGSPRFVTIRTESGEKRSGTETKGRDKLLCQDTNNRDCHLGQKEAWKTSSTWGP